MNRPEWLALVVCGPCLFHRHGECHWFAGCECACPDLEVLLLLRELSTDD